MGKVKSLFDERAIAKIQKLAEEGTIGFFCCNLSSPPLNATPMATQKVDDDGTVWFFSARDSDRNTYLETDNRAQFLCGNQKNSDYISLFGTVDFVEDLEMVKKLWSPLAKVWFQEGPEDPNLTLLRFTPQEGFYWDTRHGKMIAFAKMLASVVTGKTMDDGVQGKLKP